MPYDFSDGMAMLRIDDKYGYINKNGDIIIKVQFTNAFPFEEGLGLVMVDNALGYINKSGKVFWFSR